MDKKDGCFLFPSMKSQHILSVRETIIGLDVNAGGKDFHTHFQLNEKLTFVEVGGNEREKEREANKIIR